MSTHYIYRMDIAENDSYYGSYIGQHKIGAKDPSCDGYKGSGRRWKKYILKNHIPVEKTILRLCDSLEDANYWEQFYIAQARQAGDYLWNVARGGGGHEQPRKCTDEEICLSNKERCRRWYEANKERSAENGRLYRKNNREKCEAARKRYAETHREFFAEYHRQYYQNNKERLAGKSKLYYEQNKDRIDAHNREYWKQYSITHAEQIAERNRRYNQEHKEEQNQYYSRPCNYGGETLTFRALILRLRRRNVSNPTEVAKQYLINGG